jgi:hypothetical protein
LQKKRSLREAMMRMVITGGVSQVVDQIVIVNVKKIVKLMIFYCIMLGGLHFHFHIFFIYLRFLSSRECLEETEFLPALSNLLSFDVKPSRDFEMKVTLNQNIQSRSRFYVVNLENQTINLNQDDKKRKEFSSAEWVTIPQLIEGIKDDGQYRAFLRYGSSDDWKVQLTELLHFSD